MFALKFMYIVNGKSDSYCKISPSKICPTMEYIVFGSLSPTNTGVFVPTSAYSIKDKNERTVKNRVNDI